MKDALLVKLFKKDGSTWLELQEDLNLNIGGKCIWIHKGFTCDGCSIPKFFWRIVGTPMDFDYLLEAIVHDYLYRYQQVSRARADKVFFMMLNKPETKYRRYFIYIAVRAFGWIAWRKNKKALKMQF